MIFWLFDRFLSLIYPPLCRGCNIPCSLGCPLCNNCLKSIRRQSSKTLSVTRSYTMSCYAFGRYEGGLKRFILLKFRGDRYASRQLGQLMAQHEIFLRKNFDYIVPVPLHWSRYASRGFNQAYEMAKEVGLEQSVPVHQIVKRVKRTPFQSSIALDKRQENVAHVFELDARLCQKLKSNITGRHILIIDDLMTTGSTVRSVARALLSLKPASLTVMVAARAV